MIYTVVAPPPGLHQPPRTTQEHHKRMYLSVFHPPPSPPSPEGGEFHACARERCNRRCVRTAGSGVFDTDELTLWPDVNYEWVCEGFLKCMRTASMVDLHGRTCPRTLRVSAFCSLGLLSLGGRQGSTPWGPQNVKTA